MGFFYYSDKTACNVRTIQKVNLKASIWLFAISFLNKVTDLVEEHEGTRWFTADVSGN